MPEGPREASKETPSKVSVKMEPEKLKTYGDGRSKSFEDAVAREKSEAELSPQEKLAQQLVLAPATTELGKDQREFQFLVETRARAERAGAPMNEDFRQHYAELVMHLMNAERNNPANRSIYKQLMTV